MSTASLLSMLTYDELYQQNQQFAQQNQQLTQENKELKQEVSELRQALLLRDEEIKVLKETVAELKKAIYGTRSEKSKSSKKKDQNSSNPVNNPKKPNSNSQSKAGGRDPLPEHLPRIKVIHKAEETHCPECGAELCCIHEREVETLAVMPLVFYVIVNVYQTVVCKHCQGTAKSAKAEPSLVPKSQATPELLAHVVTTKMADAVTLYRQEQQTGRFAMPISRDKLSRWLITLGFALLPFIKLLRDQYNEYFVGGIDETRLQVIKEKDKRYDQQSNLWLRYGGPPDQRVMLVDYRPDKSQDTVNDLLEDFSGYLVCDMYQNFLNVAKDREDILIYACHDHCRRRFVKARDLLPKDKRANSFADRVIRLYDQLYWIERRCTGWSPRFIYLARQCYSKIILKQMYRMIESHSVRPNSALGQAIGYMLKYRKELEAYLSNPYVPISNIMAEHIAKRVAICRKNCLFSYSESGAEAMANIMTVVYTAMIYKKTNLFDYLTLLFAELPKATTLAEIEKLLPYHLDDQTIQSFIAKRPRPQIISEPLAA